MAVEIQMLGFERVEFVKKNIKGTGTQKANVKLKKKPDTPCKAEIAIQKIGIWRNDPEDRHYGAHDISAELDRLDDPTSVNFAIQLRDQKSRAKDVWSLSVRALVMYYK
jgi:hypothetical protein